MKSIFKRKVYEGEYILMQERQMISALGHGVADHKYILKKTCVSKTESDETLIELDIEMPLLEVGEKFFIEELDLLVTIRDRVRSSKENTVYYIDYKVIEPTETYKEACERLIESSKYKNAYEIAKETNMRLQSEVTRLTNELIKEKSKQTQSFVENVEKTNSIDRIGIFTRFRRGK